jgi:hypothetical protein
MISLSVRFSGNTTADFFEERLTGVGIGTFVRAEVDDPQQLTKGPSTWVYQATRLVADPGFEAGSSRKRAPLVAGKRNDRKAQ